MLKKFKYKEERKLIKEMLTNPSGFEATISKTDGTRLIVKCHDGVRKYYTYSMISKFDVKLKNLEQLMRDFFDEKITVVSVDDVIEFYIF